MGGYIGGMGYMANGNITVSSFVKQVTGTGNNNFVVIAGANDNIVGVSGMNLKYPQGLGGSATLAAEAGDSVEVIQAPYTAMLTLGGTIATGAYVISDSSGFGITIPTTGTTKENIGARCLNGGASGNQVLVQVWMAPVFVALS